MYSGEHELIGKKVAIKCLNPEFAAVPIVVERFKREARAATAIGNEHIIDVNDLGDLPNGAPFIVMEFLHGTEFGALIEEEGALPVGRTVRIVRQVCDALAAAHRKGIVHRDLKPENIFLLPRKEHPDFVKVLDFGISKMHDPGRGGHKLTQTGMTMGTPMYMSPEQAQGLDTTDHRTDIYALGVILFEALTGEAPFTAETLPMLVVQIVTGDVPSIRERRPDIPIGLDQIIARAMAKNPADRYESVEELSRALQPYVDLLEESGTQPVASSFGTTASEPRRAKAGMSTAPTMGPTPTLDLQSRDDSAKSNSDESEEDSERGTTAIAKKRSSAVVGTIVAAAVLAAGMVVAVVTTNSLGPDREPGPTQQDTEPRSADGNTQKQQKPHEGVRIRMSATPADARIFIDDVEFPNPMNTLRARNEKPQRIRIERPEYRTIERTVLFDSDQTFVFELQRDGKKPATTTESSNEERAKPSRTGRRKTRLASKPSKMVPSARAVTEKPTPPPNAATSSDKRGNGGDGFREEF